MMFFLRERQFPCCYPVATRREGTHAVALTASELLGAKHEEPTGKGVRYIVRVMNFIPGEVMDKIDKSCLTPELSYSVGCLAGRMDLELQVRATKPGTLQIECTLLSCMYAISYPSTFSA